MNRKEAMELIRKTLAPKLAEEEAMEKEATMGIPAHMQQMDDDGESYVPVGIHGIMASTEKLLAINRNLAEPDERDSYAFKRMHTADKFMRERIKWDAGKPRRNLMYNAAKTKSLRGAHPFMFDGYSEGMLVGNPLSMPLEEINPMHLVEQARRITQMGPGGIGDEGLITDEARNVHPSQFAFVSAIEGPENSRIGVDARLAWGTKLGSNGKIYQKFFDRRIGKHRWMSPDEVEPLVVGLPK